MVRAQVLLEEDQYRFLKERATSTGSSISAVLRDSVELMRSDEAARRRQALDLLGAFEADRTDVSLRHDEYLAAAVLPDA